MSTIKQLNNILVYTKLNPKSFSEKIGLARPQAIYDIQKGKTKNFSQAMINKIISVFPEFNKSWLLTGEGEMLKSKVSNNNLEPDNNFEEIQGLTDIALYDVQLSEEKLKKANKRIELLEELVESYKLEINDLKNELLRFTKGNINTR